MSWRVRWSKRALRTVSKLARPTRKRIFEAVESFAETGQGNVKRLKGAYRGLFRLRVGEWRILFSKEKNQILLIRAVRPRSGAY